MKTLSLIIALLAILSLPAFTQQPKPAIAPPANPPTTKLEAFQVRSGQVRVKNYSRLGTVNGIGGTILVQVMEIVDPQSQQKVQGLLIEVAGSGRYDRPQRSFIDADEIDSLLKGIEYISKVDGKQTKLTNFEAAYESRGGLKVTAFNAEGGEIDIGVTAGTDNVYFKLADFAPMRALIEQSKVQIAALR